MHSNKPVQGASPVSGRCQPTHIRRSSSNRGDQVGFCVIVDISDAFLLRMAHPARRQRMNRGRFVFR